MRPHEFYMQELEKEAFLGALAGVANGMGAATMIPSLAGAAGHVARWAGQGLRGMGATGVGQKLITTGSQMRRAGRSGDDMVRGFMNWGPGKEYGAEKLKGPGGMFNPINMMDSTKGNKLTVQRGVMWAGNAAGVGLAGKAVMDAVHPPAPTPPQPPMYHLPSQNGFSFEKQSALDYYRDVARRMEE
jgi:hypothetical protein